MNDLGFTRGDPGSNDLTLTNDIRKVLGSFETLQEKLPKTSSKQSDEGASRLLGINLGRSDSIRNGKRIFLEIFLFRCLLSTKVSEFFI